MWCPAHAGDEVGALVARLIEARRGGNATHFEELAKCSTVDPWLVVEGLRLQGDPVIAAAFATARGSGPSADSLVAYARLPIQPRDHVLEQALSQGRTARERGDLDDALRILPRDVFGVTGVEILAERARCFDAQNDLERACTAYVDAAALAAGLGWSVATDRLLRRPCYAYCLRRRRDYPIGEPVEGGDAVVRDLAKSLRENEVLVVPATIGSHVVALVIDAKDAHFVLLGMQAATEVRTWPTSPTEIRRLLDHHVADWRRDVTAPLRISDPHGRIIVVAGNALSGVPFAAIAGDHEIVYARSLQSLWWHGDRSKGKDGRILCVGASGGGAALPSVEGADTMVGPSADDVEATLSRGGEWRAVHFGCEISAPPPHRAFKKSLLLGEDELWLSLLRYCPFSAGVIVFGEHEGGLATEEGHAFQFVGRKTRRVIMSRWAADAAASRVMFEKFYRLLNEGKTTVAGALKASQEFVAATDQWKEPYYWAGWELWGAP